MKDKNALRAQLKKVREGFCGVERQQADEEILKIFLRAFGDRNSFYIYNSFSSEADTGNIIDSLLKAGKRVYLPRVEGENIVAVPYGHMRKGSFGIQEPEGQAYFGDIDVTVVPLLAVNAKKYRTGYGRGYYDRYLKDRHTLKVGLGYSFQIVDFKEDCWDVPLDVFICEKGIT